MDPYIELIRKRNSLRRELRKTEQDICGHQTGHTMRHYVEWSNSGDECSKCGHRVAKRCHYVNCKCELSHS